MKVTLVGFVFLFLSNYANSAWSSFAYVIPETEKKYNFGLFMEPMKDNSNMLYISFSPVGFGHKVAWLVVFKEPLEPNEKHLRGYFWGAEPAPKDLLIKAPLIADGAVGITFGTHELSYDLELDKQFIERAYIYIDYDAPVNDGGYYYMIDLGKYYKRMQSSANKPLKQDK